MLNGRLGCTADKIGGKTIARELVGQSDANNDRAATAAGTCNE